MTDTNATPVDSQLTTHSGQNYAYTSTLFPLFYDLWVTSLFGPATAPQSPTVTSYLPTSDRPTILDIACGTGRILQSLSPQLPTNSQLVGLDHAQPMLDRANTICHFNREQTVKWICASASELPKKLAAGIVDFAIMGAGSIGHLVDDAEVLALLQGLAAVLKPETGRVLISVLKEMEGPESEDTQKIEEMQEEEMVLKSEELPEGCWFRRNKVVESWDAEGRVRTDRFAVEMLKGVEKVEWREEMCWSLRKFERQRWIDMVVKAGLEVVAVETEDEVQVWWVLKAPGDL